MINITKAIDHSLQGVELDFDYDFICLMTAVAISLIGLVCVFSSSIDIVYKQANDPFFIVKKQLIFSIVGLVIGFVVYKIPMYVWHKLGPYLLVVGFVLLVAVLIPGIGRDVKGASRWINLGFFNLQVAELVKLFFVMYMAGYLVRRQEQVHAHAYGFLKPVVLYSIAAILLLLQPDFGTTVVLFVIVMFMLFVAGVNLFQFTLFGLSMSGIFVLLIINSAYRMARIKGFLNPWELSNNEGMQLTQSLIAFGSGGIFGTGLGESVQKLFYLPEAYNDFLLAVIAEELGGLGVIVILCLFVFLVFRIILIAKTAANKDRLFNSYIAYGIASWLIIQVFINYGVNMGLLPTKGLTLPLMSAGGSSLVVTYICLAIVLRISYENTMTTNRKRRGVRYA